MRIKYKLTFAILIASMFFASCKDDDKESSNEFSNWKTRNEAYFETIRSKALSEINAAKQLYADSWTEHCDWRAYQSYSLSQGTTNAKDDTIYVQVLKKGEGSGVPFSNDSVRVFYAGWLMPSESYINGMMFDHSGQSNILDNIFNHNISTPSSFYVSGQVRGFATALQHMHIGDLWRVYIPYNLGYSSSISGSVPAYSTLIFNVELVQYARYGNKLPQWN